jgi:hypothetical protein
MNHPRRKYGVVDFTANKRYLVKTRNMRGGL